jgi:hypothetical protein
VAKDLIPSRGAVAEPLILEVTRELTAEDIARMGDAPKVSVPVLQRLRATHHRQAGLLAEGKSVKEVAAIIGCTTQRIVQLQVDPTFADLVAYYHDQMMVNLLSDAARLKAKIIDVGEMAVDELVDRMEDDAKRQNMPVGEIRKIAEFAMDRTVAPPQSAPSAQIIPAVITMNFGTSIRHDAALEGGAAAPKTIEARVEIDE